MLERIGIVADEADSGGSIVDAGSASGAAASRRGGVATPTRDRVYELIRRAILLGEYPGGSFIEEEEMSARAGVSRTPVREAFHRLHAEQYIELVPRKGAMVRQVSPRDLQGMYQARFLIESSVMELICRERIPSPPILGDLLAEMRTIRSIPDAKAQMEFVEIDWTFHSTIIALSDNEVLVDLYQSLRSRFDRLFQAIKITPAHLDKVYGEHIAILGLLQAFDADGLRATLKGHLTAS